MVQNSAISVPYCSGLFVFFHTNFNEQLRPIVMSWVGGWVGLQNSILWHHNKADCQTSSSRGQRRDKDSCIVSHFWSRGNWISLVCSTGCLSVSAHTVKALGIQSILFYLLCPRSVYMSLWMCTCASVSPSVSGHTVKAMCPHEHSLARLLWLARTREVCHLHRCFYYNQLYDSWIIKLE